MLGFKLHCYHLMSAFGFWIFDECFHAIITMRQMVGLEIQNAVAFPPPISWTYSMVSGLPKWHTLSAFGIFTHILRAVEATTTLSGPSMGTKLSKTFVFKTSGVLPVSFDQKSGWRLHQTTHWKPAEVSPSSHFASSWETSWEGLSFTVPRSTVRCRRVSV